MTTAKNQPNKAFQVYHSALQVCDLIAPISWFIVRLYLASIFFISGRLKLEDGSFFGLGTGNWDSTLALFEYEYAVPLLPPVMAAILATFGEIVLSFLLVVGFGSRIAATGLLIMTAVIEFTYQSSPEHTAWALFLLLIIFNGPGKFAIDHFYSNIVYPHRHLKRYQDKYGELTN